MSHICDLPPADGTVIDWGCPECPWTYWLNTIVMRWYRNIP